MSEITSALDLTIATTLFSYSSQVLAENVKEVPLTVPVRAPESEEVTSPAVEAPLNVVPNLVHSASPPPGNENTVPTPA